MKKILFGIMIFVLCLCFAACAATETPAAAEPEETPVAEPAPTEEPLKVIAVVADAELFLAGVDTVLADTAEYEIVKTTLAEFAETDAAAVVAYLTEETADVSKLEEAAANGAAVAVVDATGAHYVEGAMNFVYDANGAQEDLFDVVVSYPLHDTPVRLFGMFTGVESEAYAVWTENYEEGKVFPKGIYVESESEEDASAWLSAKLERFYPGMLDAIFVENEELAMTAAEIMETLGRDDAEIFVCGGSDTWLQKMQQNPRLLGATVGLNPCYAGAYAANAVVKTLSGETVGSISFAPHVIYAEDISEGIEGFFTEEMKTEYPY